MSRTALLIRCDINEANRIRTESQATCRTISNYVLILVLKAVDLDDQLFAKLKYYRQEDRMRIRRPSPLAPKRTAILIRCSIEDGERIRGAAQRRAMALNEFVLGALKATWGKPAAARETADILAAARISSGFTH